MTVLSLPNGNEEPEKHKTWAYYGLGSVVVSSSSPAELRNLAETAWKLRGFALIDVHSLSDPDEQLIVERVATKLYGARQAKRRR